MPRYKLRVPQPGESLNLDYGDEGIVADAESDARVAWEYEYGEPAPQYLHSEIGRCQVVYARDVENGDCAEDSEPGDTNWWLGDDDGRELRANEFRCWLAGPPRVHWEMKPSAPLPIAPDTIPAGAPVRHERLGRGETVAPAFKACGQWYLPCSFDGKQRSCEIRARAFGVYYSAVYGSAWPPPPQRYRLTVAGEFVAEGTERMLDVLRAARISRLDAEWEAEQDQLRSVA